MLGLSSTPEPFLENIGRELDEAYRRTADRWRQNAAVRIEVAGGREDVQALQSVLHRGNVVADLA